MTPIRENGRPVRVTAYADASLIGGAEHTLATLLRHLDERFTVDIVATDAEVGEFLAGIRQPGQLKLVPPAKSQGDLRSFSRQIAAVRSLGPEIVHVNRTGIWAGQSGIAAGLLAPGARVVVVEHSQPVPPDGRSWAIKRRLLARRLGALVAVGNYTARSIESYIGLPANFVRTIHNGIEIAPACPVPNGSRTPTVGAIGRLSPEKGFDNLCQMLALAPGVRVILIGDGPEREAIASLARDLGVEERLVMVGWQDSPSDWFPEFDLLAVPSRLEGSPPLVALHAMMSGVPVVAANVGSISEAIDDGRTGVLVPPDAPAALAAAITELLDDRPRRLRIGQQGRSRVLQSFTASGMTERFESLYEELLAPATSRQGGRCDDDRTGRSQELEGFSLSD